jgi:hypothetical protein
VEIYRVNVDLGALNQSFPGDYGILYSNRMSLSFTMLTTIYS